MSGKRLSEPLLGVVGILLFLSGWEAVPRLGLVSARFLPPASTVLVQLVNYVGQASFWGDVGQTMLSWALGLAIGSSQFLGRATHSTIEFLRPIPSVALIPLAVLLFGIKMESSLLLVIYASFWQVLLQVLYGVQDLSLI